MEETPFSAAQSVITLVAAEAKRRRLCNGGDRTNAECPSPSFRASETDLECQGLEEGNQPNQMITLECSCTLNLRLNILPQFLNANF